jgi:hypothetical protein
MLTANRIGTLRHELRDLRDDIVGIASGGASPGAHQGRRGDAKREEEGPGTAARAAETYVQTLADASVADGSGIILGAGMAVRKTAVRPPRTFTATQEAVTGTVKLEAAAAAKRASYNWQYSLDGKTWVAGSPRASVMGRTGARVPAFC